MFYTSLAVSAASAVAGVVGQQQSASAQAKADAINRENAETEADNAFNLSTTQENVRLLQEGEEKSQAQFHNALDAKKARSTAIVAAGEAGVSGVSVDALLADFSASEGRYSDALQHRFENETVQSHFNMKGYDASRTSRINAASTAKAYRQPDYFGAALRIGGAALDSYGSFIAPDKKLKGGKG
jgi:hypothetical protein